MTSLIQVDVGKRLTADQFFEMEIVKQKIEELKATYQLDYMK